MFICQCGSINNTVLILIKIGATASLRGSGKFATLACPKFALRALAQCMAREFQPKGVHVAHFIIDGLIYSKKMEKMMKNLDKNTCLNPDSIANTYYNVYAQDKSAWTLELELRPYVEKF